MSARYLTATLAGGPDMPPILRTTGWLPAFTLAGIFASTWKKPSTE